MIFCEAFKVLELILFYLWNIVGILYRCYRRHTMGYCVHILYYRRVTIIVLWIRIMEV